MNKPLRRWSPERDAIVLREYPAGMDRGDIARRCNVLPGRPVEPSHVTIRAKELKVRRSPQYMDDLRAILAEKMTNARRHISRTRPIDLTGVPATATIFQAAPGTALPPVPASWETICTTALRDGSWVSDRRDLPSYNKRRIARGVAPFVVDAR